MIDSLHKAMPDFLLTHDPATLGQFYNDYTYYAGIATLVKFLMADLKETATHTIRFLQKAYKVKE